MIDWCQKSVRVGFRIAVLLFCTATCAWSQMVGTLTLSDGNVALIRGTTMYGVSEGAKLRDGDILYTDAKGQAQVEFQGGPTLNLGPGTQALLLNLPRGRGETEIAVLKGWVKFVQKKSGPGALRFHTPVAQFLAEDATGVLHTAGSTVEMFVESGAMQFIELGKKGASGATHTVKGGEFLVRTGEQPPAAAARASAKFIGDMPRHFRDNLPARIDRFKDKKSEPKRDHEVSYAEVAAWLQANPPIKKNFVTRFRSRVHDAEFRKGLVENLRAHPEWDPVLYPEKYLPKQDKSQKSSSSS